MSMPNTENGQIFAGRLIHVQSGQCLMSSSEYSITLSCGVVCIWLHELMTAYTSKWNTILTVNGWNYDEHDTTTDFNMDLNRANTLTLFLVKPRINVVCLWNLLSRIRPNCIHNTIKWSKPFGHCSSLYRRFTHTHLVWCCIIIVAAKIN